MRYSWFAFLGCLFLSNTTTASSPPDFPCSTPPIYRTLDFTLGDWDIIVNGATVAWITLEKDGQGCVIRERYGVPQSGQAGTGIDYWDAGNQIWRRILVTSVGTIETFEGFRHGNKFVWNGREQRIDGSMVLERVEMWRENDTIRNDIYQSTDGGVTWVLRGSEIRQPRGQQP